MSKSSMMGEQVQDVRHSAAIRLLHGTEVEKFLKIQ